MQRDAYSKIIDWNNGNKRKPLILMGARQVGKTWLMDTFADEFYPNSYVKIDLQRDDLLRERIDGRRPSPTSRTPATTRQCGGRVRRPGRAGRVPNRGKGRNQHQGKKPQSLSGTLQTAIRDPHLASAVSRRRMRKGHPALCLRLAYRASRRRKGALATGAGGAVPKSYFFLEKNLFTVSTAFFGRPCASKIPAMLNPAICLAGKRLLLR